MIRLPPRPSRRTLFVGGLFILFVAFLISLVYAYRQQQDAPLTITLMFQGERKERLRCLELTLDTQHPRESLFNGTIFLNLEDTVLDARDIIVAQSGKGTYARSMTRMPLINDGRILRTDFKPMSFATSDSGHSRFPLDTSNLAVSLSFEPSVPIEVVRIVNRVPGFILDKPSVVCHRKDDGSIEMAFSVRRNLFTQVLCFLLFISALCFAVLILATQTTSALSSSVAAFFFSLWSLRGILGSQIQTFPTLLDYAIVLLCSFMLAGLLWRLVMRPGPKL